MASEGVWKTVLLEFESKQGRQAANSHLGSCLGAGENMEERERETSMPSSVSQQVAAQQQEAM